MADETIIQIKRSTETAVPTSLQPGELAYTSNGDSLWIGSPSGSNTANVVHIGSVVSYTGNSTQIGESSGGSNTELASTYAIKSYVEGKFQAYSTDLAGLDDVTLITPANNNLLVYDSASQMWENHTISGTANEVEVTFSNNNITVGLPDNVTISTNLTVNTNLIVDGTANVGGISHFLSYIHIDTTGTDTAHNITEPTVIATANTNNWTQVSIQNLNPGVNASADFIAYPSNALADDNTGFIDVGITSNGYNQAAYSITGPNDGYVFVSARAGDSLGGSLVLATDSTGTNNDIKFFTGGFTYANDAPHVVLVGSGARKGNFGINNATPEHRLSVGGTSWLDGNVDINGTANVSTLINVGANVNISTSSIQIGNSTVNTQISAASIALNGSIFKVANSSSNTTITDGFVTISDSLTVATTAFVANSTTANIGVPVYVSNNVVITGTLAAGNTTITGDLTITGTVTTVDTQNIVVEDSLMRLARNQANTASFVDSVDIGFYGVYGSTSNTLTAGFARESGSNNFVIFVDKNPTGIDNDGITTNDSLGTLYSYLASGGLTTNSSALAITANSTWSVGFTANTLSLTTALGVSSGGTGLQSVTANRLLLGNGTNALTEITNGANGTVLQIINNIPTFGMLDGGTF